MTIATTEPTKAVAGDRVQWIHSDGDRLPATWTLSYSLLNSNGDRITVTGSDNGDDRHLVSVAATTTADWEPGEYKWQRHLTNGVVRETTGEGWVEIQPNYANSGCDPRSSVKKTLDALAAVRENKATGDQLSLSVAGRSISRMSWDEINTAHSHFKRLFDQEVAEQSDALGTESESNTVKVTFNNA